MIVNEIQKLLDDYAVWLRDQTTLRDLNGSWIEINTPYLDRHNDTLQLYARREATGGACILTDDGYTIHDLEASGCSLGTEKRKNLLAATLNGFGVRLNGDALEVRAGSGDFPLRKHSLIQAMLAINDLFYLAKPLVENLIMEDVTAWLDANEIRFTPNVKLSGISGYDQLFDFVIPKSRRKPERIVQAITRATRETAQAFIHAWNDTYPVRAPESKAYAVLNDTGQAIPIGVLDAFRNWRIQPVEWAHREELLTEFAA